MKHIKTINEYNTENDDHTVDQKVNINNDKKFGEKTPTQLPLDYYNMPDEDGEIDDEDYYSTSAGRDGLYHGVEPGINKGTHAKKTAIYKMSAESIEHNWDDEKLLKKYNTTIFRIENSLETNIDNIVKYVDPLFKYQKSEIPRKITEIDATISLLEKLKDVQTKKLEILNKIQKVRQFNI